MNPSVVDEDEERLPTPPFDDLAFFATHNSSLEFSQVVALRLTTYFLQVKQHTSSFCGFTCSRLTWFSLLFDLSEVL